MLTGADQDLAYHFQFRAQINKYAKQLLDLLLANDTPAAMYLLNTISPQFDGENDLENTIQVICEVLDSVLQQNDPVFPRRLPPVQVFSLDQQDSVLSQLLAKKVIWISDLYNFSQNIRENGAIEQFNSVKQTEAFQLYSAIKNSTPDVFELIKLYFTLFANNKFAVEMASRILEDVLYKSNADLKMKKAMAKDLLSHGAQTQDIEALDALDSSHTLAELAQMNTARTNYRYLVG